MKKSNAILINANDRTITKVVVESVEDICRLIGCDLFTCVRIDRSETIYVDDEGLLKNPKVGFKHTAYDAPLAGNGLILGTTAMGDSTHTEQSIHDVYMDTDFLTFG